MRTLNVDGEALHQRALTGEKIPVIPLVFMDLDVPQYWALCGHALVYDGHTWEPLDIAMSEIRDDATQHSGLRFSMPGATDAQLALAIAGDIEGAACTVHLAWVDPSTGTVEDAMQVWAGELDVAGWEDGPQAVIHFTAEHRASVAARPAGHSVLRAGASSGPANSGSRQASQTSAATASACVNKKTAPCGSTWRACTRHCARSSAAMSLAVQTLPALAHTCAGKDGAADCPAKLAL